MRITQLEYFESVARNLSFTRASEECHVAQPAVSQQIRALEKELGFALLNRTTKGVTLTEAGRAYQGEITAILQSLDRSARKARAISLGSAGSLIFGIANSGQTAVLGAIEQFSARYPEIHIELKRAHSLNQYQQLSQGSFDVAITASPCLAGHDDICMVGKRNSTLRIAMSKEHPLAKTAKQLTTDDLIGWPHIIADCENEQLLQATYPYLHGDTSTPIVRAEDQGIRSCNDAFRLWRRGCAGRSVSLIARWLCRAPRHRVSGNARNGLGLSRQQPKPSINEVHRLRQCAPLITFIVMSCSYKRLLSPNQKPIFHKNITST